MQIEEGSYFSSCGFSIDKDCCCILIQLSEKTSFTKFFHIFSLWWNSYYLCVFFVFTGIFQLFNSWPQCACVQSHVGTQNRSSWHCNNVPIRRFSTLGWSLFSAYCRIWLYLWKCSCIFSYVPRTHKNHSIYITDAIRIHHEPIQRTSLVRSFV